MCVVCSGAVGTWSSLRLRSRVSACLISMEEDLEDIADAYAPKVKSPKKKKQVPPRRRGSLPKRKPPFEQVQRSVGERPVRVNGLASFLVFVARR